MREAIGLMGGARILKAGVLIACVSLASSVFASNSPLADAVEKGDSGKARSLIGGQADLNGAQADGMTALHWAVYKDDLETARMLVEAGADVKATNHYGVTPLSLGCLNGNGEMVELLLKAGADPKTTSPGGETVLMTAARTGNVGPVKALLERGAEVNAKERHGQTALMWAAAEGNTEAVEILLKAGADFKTPLDSGFTALFFAVREGRSGAVRALLKAGADVNGTIEGRKSNGRSPRRRSSPLILAIENGHFELAVELLEAGANPNDQRTGFTPLHTMSWVRKPNRGDGDNDLPPPKGSGNLGSLQFVRELVKHGADVNARLKIKRTGAGQLNTAGATPFLFAADTADVDLMRLLVELGADPLLPNDDNCTALLAAAGIGTLAPGEEAGTEPECIEAVQYCLDLGANINAVDKNGETVMHGAAYKEYPVLVQFLFDHGAKVGIWNRKNKHGWTPLLIAEGYRPGNFRPSAETMAALRKVMLAAGVVPPSQEGRSIASNDGQYGGSKTNSFVRPELTAREQRGQK